MNRFELETRIHSCWNIVEELKLLRETAELDDRTDNYLLGLITIYEAKFQYLFDCFEELIRTNYFQDRHTEDEDETV